MPELGTSGSVGAAGGQPPAATRPEPRVGNRPRLPGRSISLPRRLWITTLRYSWVQLRYATQSRLGGRSAIP
jgi:hypothetical protein